eukprot:TRINITY_DN10298_c0_g1_i1.p1 TRINITY_DN10298_c0_g1~~TRINITY_DN10298_c0_g1_i1.p1  ORF type:complete len:123 (-),score=29.56 TRINITY_DN10298_c0_g1_i1:27-395(-)
MKSCLSRIDALPNTTEIQLKYEVSEKSEPDCLEEVLEILEVPEKYDFFLSPLISVLEQNDDMPVVEFDDHYLYIMWDDMMLTFDPDLRVHFGRCDEDENHHITVTPENAKNTAQIIKDKLLQ